MSDTKISEFPEKALSSLDAAGTADFVGGYDVVSNNKTNKKFTFATLANWLLTKFKLTIAGSNQTVKTAVDTLNSNTVKGQTSQLPNITTLSDLNSLSAGVHDRYIAGISGIVSGWYGIIVSTTNNVDAIPTQILYGTNGTYVRHSDDKITWSNSQVAVPSKLLTKEATTTATIHLPSNGRYVIFEMCNGANSLYATMVTVYSSGAVYKLDLAKGSEVSAELSTNTLTITSTPNVSFRILVMSLEPSISMDSITIS